MTTTLKTTAAQDCNCRRSVVLAVARRVLPERDVELPVQRVLDRPVGAHGGQQDLGRGQPGQREDPGLRTGPAVGLARGLYLAEALEPREFMVFCQSLGRNDHGRPRLLPAVTAVFGDRDGVALPDLVRTHPGVRQQRVLVRLQRQAPVAAARVDRRDRAAVAVQCIAGDDLALQRDQPEDLERGVEFRAVVGRPAGQGQAQPRGIGRHHHPRARAFRLAPRAPQRLSVDGDHVPIPHQCGHVGQHPSEGRVEGLRVEHAEHRREGVMRRDRMLQVQEVPEKAFLFPAERRHSGAGRCSAQHRDEGDDEQLAEVMARVVSPRIGDVIEGGKEDLHGGGAAPGIESALQNPFRRPPQESLLRPSEPNAIPLPLGAMLQALGERPEKSLPTFQSVTGSVTPNVMFPTTEGGEKRKCKRRSKSSACSIFRTQPQQHQSSLS